jgi:hypothetical protein
MGISPGAAGHTHTHTRALGMGISHGERKAHPGCDPLWVIPMGTVIYASTKIKHSTIA